MSTDLLRVYLDPAEICRWPDRHIGYPLAWTRRLLRAGGRDQSDLLPRIPDYVRELAGYRCVRCHHPYEDGGEWSRCDRLCTHMGPVRNREASLGDESPWVHHDLDAWGMPANEAMMDDGPDGYQVKRWEIEARWRILTVHHLNGIKHDCRWWNLAALCQRCHLSVQARVVMSRPYHGEHSDWFKPYVAGFYAWHYLGLELDRDETLARMDELLDLEHRQLRIGE